MNILKVEIEDNNKVDKVGVNSCFDSQEESVKLDEVTGIPTLQEDCLAEEDEDDSDDDGPPPSLTNFGLSPRNSDGFGCSFVSSNLPASIKRDVYHGRRARSLDYYHGPVPRRDIGRKYSHQPTSTS